MVHLQFAFSLVLILASPVRPDVAVDGNLVLKDVQRTVDLTSSLVKFTNEMTLENTGKQNAEYFLFAIETSQVSHLASITARLTSDEDDILKIEPVKVAGAGEASFFKVQLRNPLAAGKTVKITVDTKFSHSLTPFPAEIRQSEKQLVKYSGNLYCYSPYQTLSQKTVVNLASSSVESYTKTKPVSKSDSSITYGPYEKKDPFSYGELALHYENNTPFLAVTKMIRTIEVSHWGNIAVEETYDMRHTGAKLKGPFSRYDYQRQPSPLSSVKSFKTVLPASAADVYYRDEIGNISTSNMKTMDDAVEVELRPRFPLFGGWKTHYVVGYNVPSYQYLWSDGGSNYMLKIPFVDHVYDNQVVDDLTVKIILPEGTEVTDVNVPFDFTRGADEVQATYLDTTGRVVIVLSKQNLVSDHIQDLKLSYKFNKMLLFREPLLVVGFFYLIFLFVIVYVRLDFSISRDDAAESKLKVACYVENAQNILDRRSALYQSYDDAINKYKASKDMSAYQANRKKVDSDHKKLTGELTDAQVQLKAEGGEASADRISEIQKLDVSFKDSVSVSATLAEKLVAGKLSKDQYLSQEEQASNKRAEFLAKMETLASQL